MSDLSSFCSGVKMHVISFASIIQHLGRHFFLDKLDMTSNPRSTENVENYARKSFDNG